MSFGESFCRKNNNNKICWAISVLKSKWRGRKLRGKQRGKEQNKFEYVT